ncbi:MAG: cytochrome C oxidase subunit IV family protein, partial [Phycisphaerales bacterium]|nr:cytochrome C oxidase subunit IV family protein [Phycisphaerales bacterium]
MSQTTHAKAGNGHGHGVGHIVPTSLLAGVLVVLLFLTWITYAATLINFGPLNIWIALLIATVKASLVGLYFMHLRWDKPFNGVILIGSLVFVMLFVSLSLTDTAAYKATRHN